MANETLNTILENQNAYIRAGEAARTALDGKVTQALNQLGNDDTSLTEIKNDLTKALDALGNLAEREYKYTHEAITTDDLDDDYSLIVNGGYQRLYFPPLDWEVNYASYYYKNGLEYVLNDNSVWDWDKEYYKLLIAHDGLSNVSAVGALALLKDGDVVTTQGNTLFINGEKVVNPEGYTFKGTNSQNGVELVKIWYFENNAEIELKKLNFSVLRCKEITKRDKSPNLTSDFYDYIPYIEYDTPMTAAPISVRSQKCNATDTFRDYLSDNIEEYYNACVSISASESRMANKPSLKKISLPNITSLPYNQYAGDTTVWGFRNNTGLIETNFDSLNQTTGNGAAYPAFFRNVGIITLPSTVTKVANITFYAPVKGIILNCNKAVFGSNAKNWYYGTGYPEKFEMCNDWQTSIDISVVSLSWAPEDYSKYIPSKLGNVGYVSRSNNDGNADYDATTDTYTPNTAGTGAYNTAHFITIPTARLAVLPQEAIDDAFAKGFEIRGA